MFLDINKIEPEGEPFDLAFDPGEYGRNELTGHIVRDLAMTGRVVPGDGAADLEGRIKATVEVPCNRCLEPCLVAIEKRFFLRLVPEAVEFGSGEVRVNREDTTLFYVEAGRLDLKAVAHEQLHLNLPLKTICGNGCRGLCPECGVNRNVSDCECAEKMIDPRLAPLRDLNKK